MCIPSTGEHTKHSNVTSNIISGPFTSPLEYVSIFVELGLIKPSTTHLPSICKAIIFSNVCLILLPILIIFTGILRVMSIELYIPKCLGLLNCGFCGFFLIVGLTVLTVDSTIGGVAGVSTITGSSVGVINFVTEAIALVIVSIIVYKLLILFLSHINFSSYLK